MGECIRRSPVNFTAKPKRTENRGDWEVVLEYDDEKEGPFLIDLSHCPKWDLQDRDISSFTPFSIPIPEEPGGSVFDKGILINRMNKTQASIIHIAGDAADVPEGNSYTDTTDASVCMALTGKNIFYIAEKLSSLNFAGMKKEIPFLLQGRFSHVPCQTVVLERNGFSGTFLFSCSRGYAHDMVHAVFDAGEEFGLKPAGEKAFTGKFMPHH